MRLREDWRRWWAGVPVIIGSPLAPGVAAAALRAALREAQPAGGHVVGSVRGDGRVRMVGTRSRSFANSWNLVLTAELGPAPGGGSELRGRIGWSRRVRWFTVYYLGMTLLLAAAGGTALVLGPDPGEAPHLLLLTSLSFAAAFVLAASGFSRVGDRSAEVLLVWLDGVLRGGTLAP